LEIRLCVRVWARQVLKDSADSVSVQAEDPVRNSGVGPGPFKLLTLATPGLANENNERIPIISRNSRQRLGQNRKRVSFHG
jgi:hypothetical protein